MVRQRANDTIRPLSIMPAWTCAAFGGLLVTGQLAACRSQESPPAPISSASALPSSAPSASAAPGEPGPGDGDIEPAYPPSVAPDPLAQRLCSALHELPAKRRAECCSGAPGFSAARECARVLSFSLREGAITLNPEDVDRCADAMAKEHEGCEWVGPSDRPVPAACLGLLEGTVKADGICRSSLDCEGGLLCRGAGPTSLGRCGAPLPAHAPCDLAVDSLAVYTRQDDLSDSHPQCSGYCMQRRCFDAVPAGGACKLNAECGPGRTCAGGRCAAAPLPTMGQACAGEACARGLRCVKGTCIAPRKSGEPCSLDRECQGVCLRSGGGAAARCGYRCSR